VFKTQFSTSLVLGRARAHSLIQDIGGTLRSNTSDVDGSEGALSNPESHTSGLPVVGGTGNLLPWRAGVRAHTLEGDPRQLLLSVSLESSVAAAAAAVAAAMIARTRSARGQVASPELRINQGVRVRAARFFCCLRGSVRGHDCNRLTRLGHRVHDNGNSSCRRKRHCHHCQFCHNPCGLKTI
jgi:hypothetical protein